ncbi:MAG: ABC transporter permease [Anaerolineae bacterium]
MFDQFKFYLTHSLNDLSINKRLTFFALLSIAAGVAAIVSLQTLSLMIGDTLEQNLQRSNRGDVRAMISSPNEEEGESFESFVDEGLLDEITVSLFGQSSSSYRLSAAGIETLQTWIDDSDYAGQVDFTYEIPLAGDFQILSGTGTGTSITLTRTGDQASQVSAFVIDPAVYPYYSEIVTVDGQTLSEVLTAPNDIVIGENVTENIPVEVGDEVRINGSDTAFTVRGIVSIEEAVQDPLSDIFAGLFGFYIMNHDAMPLFGEDVPSTDSLFFRLDDPEQTQAFEDALADTFPYLMTTSTNDLRENNEQLVDQLSQLTTMMGLISLLIGSIGIVNTMQVIVRRRMLEVAVLKTLGMQGVQITLLFLTEAFLLGIIGSLVGIVLGWAGTFVIKGAAEAIFATTLNFTIAPQPAINGFVIGVIVATVFGFLPTLAASQVRPGIVIRPQDGFVPRAGRLQTLLVIAIIVVVIALIAQTILGSSFVLALSVVAGAFVGAGLIYAVLWALIWVIGRLFPSFGIVDLKVSLRQMLASKNRGASTLLALVVGVFSLSSITLFADAINNVLTEVLEGSGGNVLISMQSENQLEQVEALLDNFDGVNSYDSVRGYQIELVSWEDSETGETLSSEELLATLDERQINFPPLFGEGEREEQLEIQTEILNATFIETVVEAREITEDGTDRMQSGRDLTVADAQDSVPRLVFEESPLFDGLGINAGDSVTYRFVSQGAFGAGGSSEEITFVIAGISAATVELSFNSGIYMPASFVPEGIAPTSVSVFADVEDAQLPAMRRELSEIQGTFALETAIFTRLISSLLDTFTAFPSLIAGLGLVVGGVVIANSVALATMERRNEIAVMKAVGLQRERVLGMLLLENSILGLIGGLIGVGSGLVAVVIFAQLADVPLDTVPWFSAFSLMMLCVGVAVLAAITSAWAASGEKPLTVLRYE